MDLLVTLFPIHPRILLALLAARLHNVFLLIHFSSWLHICMYIHICLREGVKIMHAIPVTLCQAALMRCHQGWAATMLVQWSWGQSLDPASHHVAVP